MGWSVRRRRSALTRERHRPAARIGAAGSPGSFVSLAEQSADAAAFVGREGPSIAELGAGHQSVDAREARAKRIGTRDPVAKLGQNRIEIERGLADPHIAVEVAVKR